MATRNPKHAKNPQPPHDPKESDREARIQRILQEVEKQLRQSLPEPLQSLEKTEQEVWEIGEQLRQIIERETLASAGRGYVGSHTGCACGRFARYVGEYRRQLVTRNGNRLLHRAYYHCATCRRGFCPLDQQLGIGRSECTVAVQALAARFASYLPFAKAAEELDLVCGIRLSARTLQRVAQGVGAALAAEWREREERVWHGRAPDPAARPAQLHVTMDGVYVRIAKEWKEVKVGSVYERGPSGGVTRAQYYASRADSTVFGRRMRTVAHQEGIEFCRQVAGVGDGIDWIWQEMAKQFPQAQEILDLWHALDHLWEVARARESEPEAAAAWMEEQKERLLTNRVSEVIGEIGGWEPKGAEAQELKRRVGNYLCHHEPRMAYQTYRERGFHLGSGVAEAGCKNVVQARLKGAGMRWSEAGAEAMLHLRAAWCSTGRTDFHAAARRAALPS